MQLGFLASHAYAIKTDPIHRGLFVLRDLLCRDIPDPAGRAPPKRRYPKRTSRSRRRARKSACSPGKTRASAATSTSTRRASRSRASTPSAPCAHVENDVPVDTTGELTLDGSRRHLRGRRRARGSARAKQRSARLLRRQMALVRVRAAAGRRRRALAHGDRRSSPAHGHRARRRHDARVSLPRSERGRPMTNTTRAPGCPKTLPRRRFLRGLGGVMVGPALPRSARAAPRQRAERRSSNVSACSSPATA